MQINLGCGTNILPPPWLNFDKELDITKPLPWLDNQVNFILIEHCLEHVSGPDAFRFMKEAHRVLKQDGVLRICVPELKRLNNKKSEDIIINHGHLMVYCFENLVQMLNAAGFPFAKIYESKRAEIDGHWRVITKEADDAETLRVEAVK